MAGSVPNASLAARGPLIAAEINDGNSLGAKELIKRRRKEHQSVGVLASILRLVLKWQRFYLFFKVLHPARRLEEVTCSMYSAVRQRRSRDEVTQPAWDLPTCLLVGTPSPCPSTLPPSSASEVFIQTLEERRFLQKWGFFRTSHYDATLNCSQVLSPDPLRFSNHGGATIPHQAASTHLGLVNCLQMGS